MTARARLPIHTRDAECTVDPETHCCRECGVEHGAECAQCGGRGFHQLGCGIVDCYCPECGDAAEDHESNPDGIHGGCFTRDRETGETCACTLTQEEIYERAINAALGTLQGKGTDNV